MTLIDEILKKGLSHGEEIICGDCWLEDGVRHCFMLLLLPVTKIHARTFFLLLE
jgi:hypothetical protein